MVDQFIALAEQQFGPTGGKIILVLAFAVFIASSLPAFLNFLKVVNPSYRSKKRTLEQLDIALKLTELHSAQREAEVEFVDVSETWNNLIVDEKIRSNLGERQLVRKTNWNVQSKDCGTDGSRLPDTQLTPNEPIKRSRMLQIDPSDLTWQQSVLIAFPSVTLLIPISLIAILLIAAEPIGDGATKISGYEFYLIVVFLVSPFAIPFFVVGESDFVFLEPNRTIFWYWYKVAIGSVFAYATAITGYAVIGLLVKAIFW